MTSLVAGHFVHGIVNGVEAVLLCAGGELGLAVACAEFALNAPCEVLFRRGLHVGLELFAKQLRELRGVLRLFEGGLFPVQTNLGIALAMRDASHAQVHAHLGALAVEIGLQLIEDELLTKEECDQADFGENEEEIDYEKIYNARFKVLKLAYARAKKNGLMESKAYRTYLEEEKAWLADYALYMAVKDSFDGKSWDQWEEDIRLRKPEAIAAYQEQLSAEIDFYEFLQYLFAGQWAGLKTYANEQGIEIIGDIPIYVAMDSADAWAHPELFQLDEENVPVAVAGCPPDGFSATGQLWGNPLYRWGYHKETGYQWWISRLAYVFRLYDVVRIDHFRGFDEYFSIPYGAETAVDGHWEKGPGMDLFWKVREALGEKPVIAEDLGYVTDSVRDLVRDSGFPGMKVLEFAFDSRDSGSANDYLPHNYPVNSVAYTGTHDNETLAGWWGSISKDEQKLTREYLCDTYTPEAELNKPLISLIMRSAAKWCVIPMQDYLGLDNKCRMNTPSTVGTNWKWRIRKNQLSVKLQKEIHAVTLRYGRMNWTEDAEEAAEAEK